MKTRRTQKMMSNKEDKTNKPVSCVHTISKVEFSENLHLRSSSVT